MNNVLKIISLSILLLAMFYSSIVCAIYNHTDIVDVHGNIVVMTKEESQIYNCSMFILLLSSSVLGIYWFSKMSKNPNNYWVLTIKQDIMKTMYQLLDGSLTSNISEVINYDRH